MAEECNAVVFCTQGLPLVMTLTNGANLLYVTVLIFIGVCKYKFTGFTLHLLLGMELVLIAIFIQGIVLLRMNKSINGDTSAAHIELLQQELYPFVYAYWLLGFIQLTVGPCIFWIFSTKYWSVALKVELVVEEKDINSRSKLVTTLLVGGLIFLIILPATITAFSLRDAFS